MIRPETTRRVEADPSHTQRLEALRQRVQQLDERAEAVRMKQASVAQAFSSNHRELLATMQHTTLQAEDDKHRPPDKTGFLRE